MKRFLGAALAAALATAPAMTSAQALPPGFVEIAPLPDPAAIPLPAPKGASLSSEVWMNFGPHNPVVRNVTLPTLTPVLPDAAKATGAAVIVAPGGGFFMLSMQTEGFAVARELANHGIAAFVLKYRLQPTPAPMAEAMVAIGQRFQNAPRDQASVAKMNSPEATADALAALRMIRSRAGQWHVDPKRVGIIGYSAGAMTAMNLAQTAPAGEAPAFVGYIYGPQAIDTAPADAPPLFDALAIDDPLFHATNFPVVEAWYKAKRPVELHLYGAGSHGFGVGKPEEAGRTHTLHLDEFVAWLRMQGLIAGTPAPGR
jgi:acetyl esterase/lipase